MAVVISATLVTQTGCFGSFSLTKKVYEFNGEVGDKVYEITATKNKLHIEQITGPQEGEWVDLVFSPEDQACYVSTEGETAKLAEIDPQDESMLNLFLPDGKMLTVDKDSRDRSLLYEYLPAVSTLLAHE